MYNPNAMNRLIQNLIASGVLQTKAIIRAFRRVDRQKFVRPANEKVAYGDFPLPIGFSQTISQPTTVAFMLELLVPQVGDKILDIGSGSGWTTALLADIVGAQGQVFGVEIIPELVAFGQDNLAQFNYPHARIQLAGEELGLPNEAPFDRILVSAAGSRLPRELIAQLKIGGTLVIPIASAIWRVHKKDAAKIAVQKFPGFAFVPLIEK